MASAAWERRNARARALGFESYYDYRAHNYGKRAPSTPRASGDELARLRGHRSFVDLVSEVERGRIEFAGSGQTTRDPETGRIVRIDVQVVDSRGRESTFTLRGGRLDRAHREALAGALAAAGARVAGYLKNLLRELDPDLELDEEENEAA